MKTELKKFDEILVRIGRYSSRKELMEDAVRALLRAKPELKRDVAIELYKRNEVSISRAAEICGLNIEDFKFRFQSDDVSEWAGFYLDDIRLGD